MPRICSSRNHRAATAEAPMRTAILLGILIALLAASAPAQTPSPQAQSPQTPTLQTPSPQAPLPQSPTPRASAKKQPPSPAAAADATFVGAGDIAGCSDLSGAEATAKLLDKIPGTVFAAGDLAYGSGTDAEFNDCYDKTWGRHKARTKPAPGN